MEIQILSFVLLLIPLSGVCSAIYLAVALGRRATPRL